MMRPRHARFRCLSAPLHITTRATYTRVISDSSFMPRYYARRHLFLFESRIIYQSLLYFLMKSPRPGAAATRPTRQPARIFRANEPRLWARPRVGQLAVKAPPPPPPYCPSQRPPPASARRVEYLRVSLASCSPHHTRAMPSYYPACAYRAFRLARSSFTDFPSSLLDQIFAKLSNWPCSHFAHAFDAKSPCYRAPISRCSPIIGTRRMTPAHREALLQAHFDATVSFR